MMLTQPKKTANFIVARMNKIMPETKNPEMSPSGSDDYSHGYESACEDILSAISTKNVKLLASALKDFHVLCEQELESEETEDSESAAHEASESSLFEGAEHKG